MKKKRIIISISLCVVLLITLLVSVYFTDTSSEEVYVANEDAMLAVTLDGEKIYEFPSKGMYRVDVDCTNATGTWDYDNWKLSITDLTDEEVYCNIDFVTISTTYLNDYIISLAGTEQGTGQVVSESTSYNSSTYSDATALSESDYGTVSEFSSSSASSTSGTTTTVWTYSNGAYTSDDGSMTSGTYYHLSTTVSESGYYQVCYTMTSGSTSNRLYVYVGGTAQYINGTSTYISASSSADKSGCVNLGYISSGTTVKFSQRAYTTVDSVSVYLTKSSYNTVESSVDIRYEGKDPNNYIWYNNELWRIIGVFGEESHGVSGTNLVKIIRANSIGGLAWHKSNTNDWTASSLNSLLNTYYYNATDGTDSGYCYGYSTTVTAHCDYTNIGLSSTYRSMVQNVTWYLGGYSSTSATASSFYSYERSGDYVYSGRPTSTTGNIGLMYASDYGYSVLASDCSRSTNLGSYNSSSCAGKSWLYTGNSSYQWTMTPYSSSSDSVFRVFIIGYLNYYNAYYGFAVRPVLYLASSVYIVDGQGTMQDPYIIGM